MAIIATINRQDGFKAKLVQFEHGQKYVIELYDAAGQLVFTRYPTSDIEEEAVLEAQATVDGWTQLNG